MNIKNFFILLLFLPILCRAETINLKWNNPRNQNCWLTYGYKGSIISESRNIGGADKYTLELKDGREYWFYVHTLEKKSNVINYKTKSARNRKENRAEIKLEIE